jgi:hypothetical protein
MRGPKVSPATQTVLDARALYVKRLRETVQQYGAIPYMHQRVDPRTADMQAAMTTPESLAAMAQTNPAQAEAMAKRAEDLRIKAEQNPPPFSAPGQFEVKP